MWTVLIRKHRKRGGGEGADDTKRLNLVIVRSGSGVVERGAWTVIASQQLIPSNL